MSLSALDRVIPVTPVMLAPFLLTACQQADAPASNQAAAVPTPQKATPEGDVAAAERQVRARLGNAGSAIRFVAATRSASEGIPVICGAYEQGGRRQRYIVVNGEEAFVEPQMQPGQMERAAREFCGEGTDNRPPPGAAAMENVQ